MNTVIIPISDKRGNIYFTRIDVDDTKPSYNRLTETLAQIDVTENEKTTRRWVVIDATHIVASMVNAVASVFR